MAKQSQDPPIQVPSTESRPRCGIVMPISACDTCSEQHWNEVKAIIIDSVETVGFAASLVSDADDVGIIQKRIIQNLYDNPIVVCDVSGKNPNVMFELGMRLAFDKPTIIVKDDKTAYSFDTSPIEHLEYPRDLRFSRIVDFKRNLGEKVKATVTRAESDSSYTTFLKHFGKFSVAKLETTEISKEDFIIEELKELRRAVSRRDVAAERELAMMMERELFRRVGPDTVDSPRRRKLASIVEQKVMKLIAKSTSEKGPPPFPELVILATKELMSDPEVRQLCDSPNEVEELTHALVRKLLG